MPPARPALKYYGGKWKIANWIISFFPSHTNYVEPCGGAASVLLIKPRSPLETYNDLDHRVVNFFKVLRERPEELISLIRLTPWSRIELENSQILAIDPLEDARRFFVTSWQSISTAGRSWRSLADYTKRPRSHVMDMIEIDHLHAVAYRLKNAQLECRDALEVIKIYDNNSTLTYFDPPYLHSVRVNKDFYTCEVDEDYHIKAAGLLNQCKGFVVVSGYACPEYTLLYEDNGWKRFDKPVVCNAGARRTESVWLSPRTLEAVNKPRELDLFGPVEKG